MGTWGPHSFDNDAAADWLAAFRETGAEAAVRALEAVMGDGGEDADVAAEALAASEVVAIVLGQPRPGEAPAMLEAVEPHAAALRATDGLADLARQAVGAALNPTGELYELWVEDAEAGGTWMQSVGDLLLRLEAAHREHGQSWTPREDAPGDAAGLRMSASEANVFRLDMLVLSDRVDRLTDLVERRFDEIADRLSRLEGAPR